MNTPTSRILTPPPRLSTEGPAPWPMFIGERGGAPDMPIFAPVPEMVDPGLYLPEAGLREAVRIAIAIGQPLLVTGEPGTGKTQLAFWIARELGAGAPLIFNTKTTTTAAELFYHYDALRHFHASQLNRGELEIRTFIEFQALGLAILRAMPPQQVVAYAPAGPGAAAPCRSVVLIDEIDKAPRDVPNDVLNELEEMAFSVREAAWPPFRADPRLRPIVVLTSNSEKNLPDAFLRRCVFYHLKFPDATALQRIISNRLPAPGLDDRTRAAIETQAVEHFEQIRELPLRKRPATAELLAWVRVLHKLRLHVVTERRERASEIATTYAVIAKNREDLQAMREHLGLPE